MQTVIFDFHNVLGRYNYSSDFSDEIRQQIDQLLIGNDWEMMSKWLKGQLTAEEVHQYLADQLNLPYQELWDDFMKGERELEINRPLLDLANQLKNADKQVGVISDNIDTFTTYTAPYHGLPDMFDFVINSADHGVQKYDQGELFDKALELIDIPDYSQALLIDDAPENSVYFRQRGGQPFQYVFGQDQPLVEWLRDVMGTELVLK